MLTIEQKIVRLQKLGYACGPDCVCARTLATVISDDDLAEMEEGEASAALDQFFQRSIEQIGTSVAVLFAPLFDGATAGRRYSH